MASIQSELKQARSGWLQVRQCFSLQKTINYFSQAKELRADDSATDLK